MYIAETLRYAAFTRFSMRNKAKRRFFRNEFERDSRGEIRSLALENTFLFRVGMRDR